MGGGVFPGRGAISLCMIWGADSGGRCSCGRTAGWMGCGCSMLDLTVDKRVDSVESGSVGCINGTVVSEIRG